MKQYSYEQIDEHIQWLIKMMNTEYPNNYELIIDSNSGTIRSTQANLVFLRQDLKRPIFSESWEVNNDKNFNTGN